MINEISKVVEICEKVLDLANVKLPEEYYYMHLPLCVIDAVFSIGVTYTSTKNTIDKFCKFTGLQKLCTQRPPDISSQFSILQLFQLYNKYGSDGMAENVYKNKQRTSTRGGILKSEAVLKFSKVLLSFGVNYFQDVHKIIYDANFENAIKQIPGQSSGISLSYFYMLAGSEDEIKPDRMIQRFIQCATGKFPNPDECKQIICSVYKILSQGHPTLTPRLLDYLIWSYQRQQK